MEGMSAVERLVRVTGAYDEAGGTGAKVLIRRVWLGPVRGDLVDRQRRVYDAVTGDPSAFGADQTVAGDDASLLTARLIEAVHRSGATLLDLRVHLPGMSPAAVREQIAGLAEEVVPNLRRQLRRRGRGRE